MGIKILRVITWILFLPFITSFIYGQEGTNAYGEQGLFHLHSSLTMFKGKFFFGVMLNNIDRDPLDIDIQSDSFAFGYALSDSLQISAIFTPYIGHDVDLKTGYAGFYNSQLVAYPRYFNGMGDVRVAAKYSIIDKAEREFGAAVRVFAKIPFADEKKGVGTGEIDYGFDIIIDRIFNNRLGAIINIGIGYHGDPVNAKLGTIFSYGAGCYFPYKGRIQGLAEIKGGRLSEHTQIDSYADLSVGIRFLMENGFNFTAGLRRNLMGNSSNGENPYSIMFFIGYIPRRILSLPPPPPPLPPPLAPPPPPPPPPSPPSPPPMPPLSIEPPYTEIYFAFDKYDLSNSEKTKLDQIVIHLLEHLGISLKIEGHTCSIGTEEYNMVLGAHRANAVKQYMHFKGINNERMEVISYGESRPKYDNSSEETRKLNRRVWFIF